MVDITKPVYGSIWANSGEKLPPDQNKIAMGWIQEMMPYQYENYLQNRTDVALSYLLQKGIAEWSADQEYTANKSVVTYGGQLYMATATVTNILPTVAASWKKLSVTFGINGAIPITFGGTGATTAADARTNLGIGSAATVDLPTTNGIVTKLANNSLVARTITGVAGYITVTNGDAVSGNPTITVGENVAKTDADAAWSTKTSIKIPSGTSSERGVGAPGRIRFNMESGVYEGYDNVGWNPIGSTGTLDVQNFSGDGVKTSFTMSATPRAENNTQVYFNGVYQQKNSYNLVGSNLVFDEAPALGIEIEVVTVSSVAIGTTTAGQTSIVDSGNYYNSTNVEGALAEIGNRQGHTILSYATKAEADAAAVNLPDGQVLQAPDQSGRLSIYTARSGAAVFERFDDLQNLQAYSPGADKLEVLENNPGRVVSVLAADDDSVLPSDYSNGAFEFLGRRAMRLGHTSTIDGYAKKAIKGQMPADHIGQMTSGSHVEMQAFGSGATGPNNADYGSTIAIHKKGYAGSNPLAGEVDGLSIVVRQDGPKGTNAGDVASSDACGVLVNIQNVDDSGFVGVLEATASNYNTLSASISRSIQTQIGILDMNRTGAPGYGFVAVSSRGVNDHAFYAANGASLGGTWKNLLYMPGFFRVSALGDMYGPTSDYSGGAWSLVRATGPNGATTINHRGTGALVLSAQDATSILFSTSNISRWEVTSTGTLRPTSTNTVGPVGDPNRRITPYCQSLNIGSTSTNGVNILAGDGSPQGVVSAPIGSMFLRRDGGANTTLYIKESGTGNTGWVAK